MLREDSQLEQKQFELYKQLRTLKSTLLNDITRKCTKLMDTLLVLLFMLYLAVSSWLFNHVSTEHFLRLPVVGWLAARQAGTRGSTKPYSERHHPRARRPTLRALPTALVGPRHLLIIHC